ncbi:MAG TPA: hypothetical protein VLG44_05905 [Chlamydiales bacterium]|nr:hypothetical protein [Chlamydiales bacterium]
MQTNLFISAIHFLIVLFFLTLGCFCIAVSYSEGVQLHLMQILSSYPKLFLSLGGGMLGVALFLFIAFYLLYRKRVLRFWMTPHVASVRSGLMVDAIGKHLKMTFPFYAITPQIVLHPKNMEIILSISPFEKAKEDGFLKKAESEIAKTLHESFGYNEKVIITLSS